jgi:hypothetical protein
VVLQFEGEVRKIVQLTAEVRSRDEQRQKLDRQQTVNAQGLLVEVVLAVQNFRLRDSGKSEQIASVEVAVRKEELAHRHDF